MQYDFDRVYPRKGKHNNIKWDFAEKVCPTFGEDGLALWIADMDLPVGDFIIDAIKQRLSHPILGYFAPDHAYFNSIIQWHKNGYGRSDLNAERIVYQNGILGAIDLALYTYTSSGDSVLIQTPGYHKFKECVERAERKVTPNPLKTDNGIYTFDFDDMERKIIEEHVKMAILCSPHNPTGRVWTEDELRQYVSLCKKYNVVVISDEAHCDLAFSKKHIPIHEVDSDAIALYSVSKPFNLAGLCCAYAVIGRGLNSERYKAASGKLHYNSMNVLSMTAQIAAYEEGREWLDEVKTYIAGNMDFVLSRLNIEGCKVKGYMPEATYLMWLDCSEYDYPSEELQKICCERTGILLNNGTEFIADGEGFMRMNAACPRQYLEDAMTRIIKL